MFDASENDIRFALRHTIGLDEVVKIPAYSEVSEDLVDAVLSEAAKLATDIIAPLNHSGDVEGAKWSDGGKVTTPKGFADAFKAMAEGGWCGIDAPEEFGGQAMPKLVSSAVAEMWHSANMGFALCHLLSQGLIHALNISASDEQKATYLPKLIDGTWTGTMNLTEAQAGTDLAALRTSAVKEGDHYRIKGQKIFITYGEHDMAENIVHLVLARTPDAPEGVKGISVFIVPKFLVNEDGSLGERNDVKCVSIEHKLGINGSPTAVLQFGEKDGAIGYLVGEENMGLQIMFGMMNHARFGVGMQGLSIANRAYTQARAYSADRIQGTPLDREKGDNIQHHPDVMRLLSGMRSEIEAMRALALYGAAELDKAENSDDPSLHQRAELMIPIIKGWLTERSVELASDAVQVHGGMGFIEETGAAQHYRDARILPIYEGTTAIQANDLLFRKTLRDQGKAVRDLLADMANIASEYSAHDRVEIADGAKALGNLIGQAEDAVSHICGALDAREASAVSVPYLMMLGTLAGSWMSLRSAKSAADQMDSGDWDPDFLQAKLAYADVFAAHCLPRAASYAATIKQGARSVEAMKPAYL